jgi:hypothetical protein
VRRVLGVLAMVAFALGGASCTSGTAYVGVYGPPVYGPGPWGPYGRPYGPYGYPPGGVWVGVPVCCDEEQQQEEPDAGPEDDRDRDSAEGAEDAEHSGTDPAGTEESGAGESAR